MIVNRSCGVNFPVSRCLPGPILIGCHTFTFTLPFGANKFSSMGSPVLSSRRNNIELDNSWRFKSIVAMEKLGIRDDWKCSIVGKIVNRLERPRFDFPGVFDRAPPPPKTLHWRYAPAEGEYHKIRSMLCWSGIHIGLIRFRISGSPYQFLVGLVYDYLYNELVSKWLPEASIPSFSIKGEAKKLVDELRLFVDTLSPNCPDRFIEEVRRVSFPMMSSDDPVLSDLKKYILDQRDLLGQMSLSRIVESPDSWMWID